METVTNAAQDHHGESFDPGFSTHSFFRRVKNLPDMPTANDDQHETRAKELDALGKGKQALRVRTCGSRAFFKGYPVRSECKIRVCPSCAARVASKNAEHVVNAVILFANQVAYLLTMPPMRNLEDSWDRFRQALAKVRRLAAFRRAVAGGVSAIETRLGADGKWQVHAHLILDADGLDLATIRAAWRKLTALPGTNWHGDFQFHRDPKVDLRYLRKFAEYICKADTWCPPPANLPTPATQNRLEQLLAVMRGKHLLIAWGTGRKPKESET